MRKQRITLLWFGLSILGVLIAASAVRFYGLNWDEDQHLHPDERYLTMVVSAVRFPGEADGVGEKPACESLGSCARLYWNTATSPLNPGNYQGFENYVYGTFPLFTTRAVARWVDNLACVEPSGTWLGRGLHALLTSGDEACHAGFYTGYGGIHLVGRALSAGADLASLIGIVAVGYVVYGKRTAALTGLLYAFTVLPIQHAHFFVVDSFATVFVIWALLFCALSLRSHRLCLLPFAGLMTGLAMASKVSVWPLALIVTLAAVFRRGEGGGPYRLRVSGVALVALASSGLLAALAFRSAQPYAFSGPGFFGITINPTWLATMREIGELMRGVRDVPFGHQWTARTPIVFPWRNMVVWGMGIPLGLFAWIGWAVMGWRIIAKRDYRHALLWTWATLFFAYQATQWVKSMRYLLPVYPVFALFAGWLGARLVRWASRWVHAAALWRKAAATVLRAIPALVAVGTALWSWAFLSIYRQPVTRIAASRWILENIPTAVVLHTADGSQVSVPADPEALSLQRDLDTSISLVLTNEAEVHAVILPRVDGQGIGGRRLLEVELLGGHSEAVSIVLTDSGSSAVTLPLPQPALLRADSFYDLTLRVLEGEPVQLQTSVIANEHWDDALPLRVDGADPFRNWYADLKSSPSGQMNHYDNDSPAKRRELLNWLNEADYIILSSNRLYASIPRLPKRYPLTTAYYERLFEGSLGFKLAATFHSYPALGACEFPDQEQPFSPMASEFTTARPCSIRLPAAEEAFSVYDHPSVAVFAKTAEYSRELVEAMLPPNLVENVQWMTPKEVGRTSDKDPDSLLMTPKMRAQQEGGGTWSGLFHTSSLWNRLQPLTVLLWAAMMTLLGWSVFPLIYHVFPDLRLRGYGIARALGLLLWSYLAWLLASLRLLPFTRAVLWLLVFLLAGLSIAVGHRHRASLRGFVSRHWRALVSVDVIFLILYLVWVMVRWFNPDLWHPVTGGEKPMDFAYLNAVIKSTWFPPYDPWFAGGKLNYYYFGFVVVASLTKALGIVPSVAYNLAVPSLFALTGVGAYSLASNLAGGDWRRGHRAGIWGLLFVAVLGNLGEARFLANGFAEVGNVSFESLIPGYQKLISMLVGLWRVVIEGAALPFRPESWYWDATRIIPVLPGEVGPINEFPAFTFLYADLHAHMMALPITQLALAVALQWGLGAVRHPQTSVQADCPWWKKGWARACAALPSPVGSLVIAALVAGALRATNTWDYPTYLALMSAGFVIGRASLAFSAARAGAVGTEPVASGHGAGSLNRQTHRADVSAVPSSVDTPGGGILAMAEAASVSGASSLPATVQERAPGQSGPWWLAFGAPLVLLLSAELLFRPFTANYAGAYAAFDAWEGSRTPLWTYLVMHGHFLWPIVAAGLASLVGIVWSKRRTLIVDDLLWPLVIILTVLVILVLLVGFLRVDIAWLAVPLGGLAVFLATAGSMPVRFRLLWFWIGTALALSLLVEVAVLKGDIGRMNTVFKFYLQVWMLLALGAAVFTERIIHAPAGLLALAGWGSAEAFPVSPSDAATNTPVSPPVATSAAENDGTAGRIGARGSAWLTTVSEIVATGVALLAFLAGLYPALAIPAKARDRWTSAAPQTLDGMAYMQHATQYEHGSEIELAGDYHVIRWLQENVAGSPTIIEAQADREYLWGNRVSTYTGLPSVAGWRWHQVQQRMVMPPGTVEERQQAIRVFYNTPNPEQALSILREYDVQYVVLTQYERAYMVPGGVPKFAMMVERGYLEIVYQDGTGTVYRVTGQG